MSQQHWYCIEAICRPRKGQPSVGTFAEADIDLDADDALASRNAVLLEQDEWTWTFKQGRHVYACQALVEAEDPMVGLAALQDAVLVLDDALLEVEAYRVTLHPNAIVDPLDPSETQRLEAYRLWTVANDEGDDPGAKAKYADGIEIEREDGLRLWFITAQECADAGVDTGNDSICFGVDRKFEPVRWYLFPL